MHTPTHIGMAVAVFGKNRPQSQLAALMFGGFLPDLLMFMMFGLDLLLGYTPSQIFDVNYFTPRWQIPLDLTNSIPIFGLIALLAWRLRREVILMIALGALLHIAFDLPLHREDAHAHFYPLTSWHFISPVSYWDKDFFAKFVSPVELVMLVASIWISWKYLERGWLKWGFAAVMFIGVLMQLGIIYWHWFAA